MSTPVGWWALDTPLDIAHGGSIRSVRRADRPITIETDHRTKHCYCVGSSGAGKSRFLRRLLNQDVDANRSFSLIDSQDLQVEILHYITQLALPGSKPTAAELDELGDKLVLIEPGNQQFGVPGINLLQLQPGQLAYTAVDAILSVLKELWADSYGARMEDICRNSLLLLQEQGLTVLEMLPFLSDRGFRDALVARCRNVDVRMYFEQHLHGISNGEMRGWIESSRNKCSAFLINPMIRPILGQSQSTISFRDIIDQGKWLVVAVSRDKLKESRRLLGALVVSLLHQAAVSRERTPPEQRHFHAIYCDEFQEYFCDSFLSILESGRKYGLGLVLAQQNLTQPPFDRNPAYVDTIIGNSSTLCVFNVGRKDAVRLSQEMFFTSGTEVKYQQSFLGIPLEKATYHSRGDEKEHFANELMKQRQAELYVKLKGGRDEDPFVARVPKVPDVIIDHQRLDLLRQHVARRYYRPVADVQREIAERWARIRPQLQLPPPIEPRDFTR